MGARSAVELDCTAAARIFEFLEDCNERHSGPRNIDIQRGWDFLYRKHLQITLEVLLGLLFISFAGISLFQVFTNLSNGNIWFNDFFGIWSFEKFAFAKPIAGIYDKDGLLNYQMDLGACPTCHLPFVYPPFFLLLLLPLGFLSYYLAYVLWDIVTLTFYFVASAARGERWHAPLLFLFAPATVVSFTTGQTGLLASALIVGGFRLVTNRPMLSGALFGLAAFKPQLGILIPVALISARLWRTAAAAGVTVLVLIFASSIAFGWSIWPLWFAKLLPHADWVLDVKDRYNPTITSNLTSIGVDLPIARAVQACIAVLVAVIIWICFRGGVTILATAALLVGTFLATPYAIIYDMPMLTNAVLAVLRDRDQTDRALTIPETLILVLSLVLPIIMIETWRLSMFRSIPLILLFGLILWRIFGFRSNTPNYPT